MFDEDTRFIFYFTHQGPASRVTTFWFLPHPNRQFVTYLLYLLKRKYHVIFGVEHRFVVSGLVLQLCAVICTSFCRVEEKA